MDDQLSGQRPFRWADIHQQVKEKLTDLESELRKSVIANYAPFPSSMGEQRQFLVMLEDQANDWVERASETYTQCLTDIGRKRTYETSSAIWHNGLSYFIREKIHALLMLACFDAGMKAMLEIQSKNLRSSPLVVSAHSRARQVNQIVSRLEHRWQHEFLNIQTGSWLADTKALLKTIRDPSSNSSPPVVLVEVLARLTLFFNMGDAAAPHAGRRGNYFQAWTAANGGPPRRNDRLSPRIFTRRYAQVSVGDTTKNFKQTSIARDRAYSVVRRVVRWESRD